MLTRGWLLPQQMQRRAAILIRGDIKPISFLSEYNNWRAAKLGDFRGIGRWPMVRAGLAVHRRAADATGKIIGWKPMPLSFATGTPAKRAPKFISAAEVVAEEAVRLLVHGPRRQAERPGFGNPPS